MEICNQTLHNLIEDDKSALWHPFTQMQTSTTAIPIVKAQGIYLYSADGKRYMDGISSWWVNLHGHGHPCIVNKIKEQAEQLEHVIFADFTHPPAIELAKKLLSILPGQMDKIFYSDNGSTAVETALKMALQFWYNKNPKTPRVKVICFKNGYHGDTFGAMSAAGRNNFNKPFWKHLFDVEAIDPPLAGDEQKSLTQLKLILDKGEAACFIFEPLVMAASGMVIYPPEGLEALMQSCRNYNVLTIADEVMIGFGRTGTRFACDQLNISPDIICLSKGITGGFLPLGATACTNQIYNAFLSDRLHHALLHGHSYAGNPIACASAIASFDLLTNDKCDKQREMIAGCHRNFCETWRPHPKLSRCESLGTLLALTFKTENSSYFEPIRNRLYRYFLDNEILLRPLGNVLYVLPPYCIQPEELEHIYRRIAAFTMQ